MCGSGVVRVPSSPIYLCNAFEGHIIEITMIEGESDTSINGEKISKPYWRRSTENPNMDSYADRSSEIANSHKYSTHPVAVKVRPTFTIKMTIVIEVTKAEGISGSASIQGRLDESIWTGSFNLRVGIHQVIVEIPSSDPSLKSYVGDIIWEANVTNCGTKVLGSTRVEIYRIVDDPMHAFIRSSNGRPIEALRFLYEKIGIGGLDAADEIVNNSLIIERITTYLHSSHQLTYDIELGNTKYLDRNDSRNIKFMLVAYINRSNGNTVNCYDQASAVFTLSYVIGLAGKKIYVDKFGFINEAVLVGGEESNNPFYGNDSYASDPVVPRLEPRRSSFGNHEFYIYARSQKVFDACSVPHLGSESYEEYMFASVDTGVIWASLVEGERAGFAPVEFPSHWTEADTWKRIWLTTDLGIEIKSLRY